MAAATPKRVARRAIARSRLGTVVTACKPGVADVGAPGAGWMVGGVGDAVRDAWIGGEGVHATGVLEVLPT